MRGEPSETARPAVVAPVQNLCSNERAAPRRSSAQRAATSPTARVRRRPAAGAVLQGRPASSSARAHGQAALFQLVSIISDACRATELIEACAQPRPSRCKVGRCCLGPAPAGTLDALNQCDRSQPPDDPSVTPGGIDGYRIEMAKNEAAAQLVQRRKTHAGNAARASKMHERARTHPYAARRQP